MRKYGGGIAGSGSTAQMSVSAGCRLSSLSLFILLLGLSEFNHLLRQYLLLVAMDRSDPT